MKTMGPSFFLLGGDCYESLEVLGFSWFFGAETIKKLYLRKNDQSSLK
jgi:hypothetical protein